MKNSAMPATTRSPDDDESVDEAGARMRKVREKPGVKSCRWTALGTLGKDRVFRRLSFVASTLSGSFSKSASSLIMDRISGTSLGGC